MENLQHRQGIQPADKLSADLVLPNPLRVEAQSAVSRLDRPLSKKFIFKLAQTKEELEACFRLLHDEYVRAGLMKPDPSGMRVTLYHALPTTSMLMCCYENQVIGTVSLIRESSLNFPMERIFNINGIVPLGSSLAEVSALAIDRRFRAAGNRLLMPLLKFLYEYAAYRFDTRCLIIAAHPEHISFYVDVLCFRRLPPPMSDVYDFVNFSPAAGAYLDLEEAKTTLSEKYAGTPLGENLYYYFTAAALPNGRFPHQRLHTNVDPVMTPELLDYFFNKRTKIFASLRPAERLALHATYKQPEYKACLPLP